MRHGCSSCYALYPVLAVARPSRGRVAASFGNLDVTGQLLFLLGQNIATGGQVEKPVDQVLRAYLVRLWQERSNALEAAVQADEGEESEPSGSDSDPDPAAAEENLVEEGGATYPSIRSYFSAAPRAGLEADGHMSML